jgi:hypothetical protein
LVFAAQAFSGANAFTRRLGPRRWAGDTAYEQLRTSNMLTTFVVPR